MFRKMKLFLSALLIYFALSSYTLTSELSDGIQAYTDRNYEKALVAEVSNLLTKSQILAAKEHIENWHVQ